MQQANDGALFQPLFSDGGLPGWHSHASFTQLTVPFSPFATIGNTLPGTSRHVPNML